MGRIGRSDHELAEPIRAAASSVSLNIAAALELLDRLQAMVWRLAG